MKTISFFKKLVAALLIAAVAFAGCEDDPVKVTGVTLNKTALTLAEGGGETLMTTVTPADAENKAITRTVIGGATTGDQNGKVTAIKAGEATVTVAAAETPEEVPENWITFVISFAGDIGSDRTRFALAGSGEATIDWGDGSAMQTVTLNPLPEW